MVAAALCPGLTLSAVVHDVVPALKVLQQQCRGTSSSADVERFLHATESALRRKVLPDPGPSTVSSGQASLFRYFAQRPEMGKDHQGLLRLLYHIERETPPQTSTFHSFSLRVPPCADSIVAAAELWLRFLASKPDMPPLRCAIAPDHGRWLDLMVGIPTPQQLFCLCAPVEVLPCTSDVPYTLERDFLERVHRFLEQKSPATPWP